MLYEVAIDPVTELHTKRQSSSWEGYLYPGTHIDATPADF